MNEEVYVRAHNLSFFRLPDGRYEERVLLKRGTEPVATGRMYRDANADESPDALFFELVEKFPLVRLNDAKENHK